MRNARINRCFVEASDVDIEIAEKDTHKQLLRKDGHYRRLWDMQQDGILPDEKLHAAVAL